MKVLRSRSSEDWSVDVSRTYSTFSTIGIRDFYGKYRLRHSKGLSYFTKKFGFECLNCINVSGFGSSPRLNTILEKL